MCFFSAGSLGGSSKKWRTVEEQSANWGVAKATKFGVGGGGGGLNLIHHSHQDTAVAVSVPTMRVSCSVHLSCNLPRVGLQMLFGHAPIRG